MLGIGGRWTWLTPAVHLRSELLLRLRPELLGLRLRPILLNLRLRPKLLLRLRARLRRGILTRVIGRATGPSAHRQDDKGDRPELRVTQNTLPQHATKIQAPQT